MIITYGITVCDEFKELETLLSNLIPLIDPEDEVIILRDMSKTCLEIDGVLDPYGNKLTVIKGELNKDFASFKNKLIEKATGDYLFQIDADEIPNSFLINNLKQILQANGNIIDCYYIPRINRVNKITFHHVEKWGWKQDESGRINFPDYQLRLFKLGIGIKWVKPVHETLTGYNTVSAFPHETEDFCLYHIKDIEKQEKQNSLYESISN